MFEKYFLLCLLSLILLQACKKKEEDPPKPKPVIPDKELVISEFYRDTEKNEPEFKLIADVSDGIKDPKDLDFQKLEGKTHQLWVLNPGTGSTGGSTVTIFEPGTENQRSEYRQDGNAWHFMALSTALDFSKNGDWGTSQGILDANRRGINYSGPTLWPGDLDIYAIVGNPPTPLRNGSHLDMVHQSPYGMGICNLKDNEYFVFDGYHGNLTYYDFAGGHPPGGDDHSDGKVIHYSEVKLTRDPSGIFPGHMEVDAAKKWLYVVDTDKKRILKVNIKSGNLKSSPSIRKMHNEPLDFYGEMENVEWSVLDRTDIEPISNLTQPCGLAINENRVFISDCTTNEIVCFSTEDGQELDRIKVEAEGIMGITIGPGGGLWYVDHTSSKVYRVIPK